MLHTITLFLAAAVIFVLFFRRVGLGAVLGYLAAGLVVGPGGLGFISDVEEVLHFSELGVILLLFVIGLELQPKRLWRLRRSVIGVGGLQMLVTGLALAGVAMCFNLPTPTALVVGFALAMSSTALVLQVLTERKELTGRHGRMAFSVLLFQDIAVIPFLAVIPLMGVDGGGAKGPDWFHVQVALVAIAAMILGGRFALRPIFRLLAGTGTPEVFTAAALLLVVGTALLMESVGFSMSLGAFLAGVLLADSEFRHEIQASIEPFKGLLLGLFFMAVGMGVDLTLIASAPGTVFGFAIVLLVVKGLILFGVGRRAGLDNTSARRLAFLAPQGGEFAFVLFGVAVAAGVMDVDLQALMIVVVTISMVLTPPLYLLQMRWGGVVKSQPYDDIQEDQESPVVIAGFGPFGQIVARILKLRKIPFTVLEADLDQVEFVRQFGNPVFYSDASRLDVLRSAHVDKAKLFVISVAEPEEVSLKIAELVHRNFPQVKVFAVARTRQQALRLMDAGCHRVIRRAYLSSLEMSRDILVTLGEEADNAQSTVDKFREFDEDTLLRQQAIHRDPNQMLQSARESAAELDLLFESDQRSEKQSANRSDAESDDEADGQSDAETK